MTGRANESKDEQETAVKDRLVEAGFTKVARRTINNMSEAPEIGTFCGESQFGTRKADIIARLYDGRIMPIEAKVSNSSTNSVKRLNNDAAVKARQWTQEFGTSNVVPSAVLGGVFKTNNLRSAQDNDAPADQWSSPESSPRRRAWKRSAYLPTSCRFLARPASSLELYPWRKSEARVETLLKWSRSKCHDPVALPLCA